MVLGFAVALTLVGVYLAGVKVYDEASVQAAREKPLVSFLVDLSYKRRIFEVLLDLLLVILAYYFSYVLLFGEYRDRVLTADRAAVMRRFRPESPHNVYIATAANTGIPSLIAYFAVIVFAVGMGVRAARLEIPLAARLTLAGLIGAVAVHLVTDSFMTAEPAGSAIFWILLGATAGLAGGLTTGRHESGADGHRADGFETLL